jgi:hypothetical protein
MDRWKTSQILSNLLELVALLAGPALAVPAFFLCHDIANGAVSPALLLRFRVLGPILALAAFFQPAAAFTMAIGYALIAGIHFIAGLELQPLWFRAVTWMFLAALLTVVPLDGLAFCPIGALIADLCVNRRTSSYMPPRQATA